MTPDQIRLVQESFRLVVPIRDQAAALFYGKLFELDPGTRGLFASTDLKSQGGKLMAAIAMVVNALDAPEAMLGKVKALARRHVHYGVEEGHYATVGRGADLDARGRAWRKIHAGAPCRLDRRLHGLERHDDRSGAGRSARGGGVERAKGGEYVRQAAACVKMQAGGLDRA